MLEQTLEQDIKTAMLAGDSNKVTILRGLKSVLLNVKVAQNKRDVGLTDEEVLPLLAKEAKKRQESADLYIQGGDQGRADQELSEKAIIETYLPKQLTETEISAIVDQVIAELGATGPAQLGQVIGQVKQRTQGSADGGVIAGLVKQKLTNAA
jgi:uncharacterized protein YqeY